MIQAGERLWLLLSGWQPVSTGWLMRSDYWGVVGFAANYAGMIFSDDDALYIQKRLCEYGKVPDCSEYQWLASPPPAPSPKQEIPKPARKSRQPRKKKEVPVVMEQSQDDRNWRRGNGSKTPLWERTDARRVNHKSIMEDSSPWSDIALRNWEDAAV